MSNFIIEPASLVFTAISKFWFSVLSRFTMYKLTTAVTAFLEEFLIKSNKKLDQIIFQVSENLIIPYLLERAPMLERALPSN